MKNTPLIAPENYNIAQEIEQHNSKKMALYWENDLGEQKDISYENLIKEANKIANAFTNLRIEKGDRVLVMMPRMIETYVIYLACLKKGIILIPSSELLRKKDLLYRMNHAEVKAVVAHHNFTKEFNGIEKEVPFLLHRIAVDGSMDGWKTLSDLTEKESENFKTVSTNKKDIAFLSYTSGTTGQPKGVVHRHSWGYAHIRIAANNWLNIQKEDLVWATAAPGWQKWIWTPFLSILGSGATGYIYNGKFDPEHYLKTLEEKRINVLCCTPTEYRMMAKLDHLERFNLSRLRSAVSAGEALNQEVINTFKKQFNLSIRDGYGQTENTLLIGTLFGMKQKEGSMGKPLLDGYIEIVDENGQVLPEGMPGNIAVKKDFPALFATYYKNEEKMKNAFSGDYYLTGDRAKKDQDGYFWYEGRNDDVIISSGYTIGPFEVEEALMKHVAVKECAVIAFPDEVRGNVVKACISLKEGIEGNKKLTKDIQSFVKNLTAPYKYPRIIEYFTEFPKTDSGKIKRAELRKKTNLPS